MARAMAIPAGANELRITQRKTNPHNTRVCPLGTLATSNKRENQQNTLRVMYPYGYKNHGMLLSMRKSIAERISIGVRQNYHR